jgi:diaminopimelate decarboxylase
MFDHAHIRPRVLRTDDKEKITSSCEDGFQKLSSFGDSSTDSESEGRPKLYASTVFGPTCDSIDVIARSVLLPKLTVGDWMYFQNMGAYTMAASSSFNGFNPSEKLYVSSVSPDFFEALIKGPPRVDEEEKKADS